MSRQTEAMEKALSQIKDALGFVKNGYYYSRPGIRNEFIELLDLRTNGYGREQHIWIQTCIHHIKVKDLHNQLAEKKLPETVSLLGLGYIDPLFSNDYELTFTKIAEIPKVLNEIESLFNNKFLSFYNEYENLEKIIDYYEKNYIDLERRFNILPLLYYLTGKPEKGIEIMEPLLKFGLVSGEFNKHFFENYCNYINISVNFNV